ncbi:MAG: hypothetical protein AB1705_27290 [Verrucomicrobiota bacterium]
MKLSTLAIVLGLAVSVPQIYGLLKPTQFAAALRKFPRSLWWGYALMALATGWFIYYINQEEIADFASYKKHMMTAFGVIGVLTCVYVTDFLAVRGLAIVMMLLAKLMVDTARWVETDWRLVIVVWAYLLVIAGMWFTISPWRLRDILNWATATEHRVRLGSGVRLAFGLFVLTLGLTVF